MGAKGREVLRLIRECSEAERNGLAAWLVAVGVYESRTIRPKSVKDSEKETVLEKE